MLNTMQIYSEITRKKKDNRKSNKRHLKCLLYNAVTKKGDIETLMIELVLYGNQERSAVQ